MKYLAYLIVLTSAGLMIGCATSLPLPELLTARQAYRHASESPAADLAWQQLHEANLALAAAENSFQYAPQSYRTRDLAYIADRKARKAEALGMAALMNTRSIDARNAIPVMQATSVERDDLDELGSVTEEARGLVLTISDSLLFASTKSSLLPSARNRLNQVTDVLLAAKNRRLTVEGHTSLTGSFNDSQDLSQLRADAVRSYLILRGYPRDQIMAHGIGNAHPVAESDSTAGRSGDGRIEIIAERNAN